MATFRNFNPPPADNQDGRCLWCGEKLPHPTTCFDGNGHYIENRKDRPKQFEQPGYLGNGFFCTLNCGYQFAIQYAKFGKRLAKEEPK